MNFDQLFEPRLELIRTENRYRVFADLERRAGHFPQAFDARNNSGQRQVRNPGFTRRRSTGPGEGPFDGRSSGMLSVVPIDNLWVEANYRETQTGRVQVGDPVRIDVDT
jgi:hypothetical protein